MTGSAANLMEDDEWEVFNDDGFVYKRKKRHLDPSSSSSSFSVLPDPQDQNLEKKNRLKQKKTTLLKIKERYEREILQWEHLSNTFSSIQQKTSIIVPLQEPLQIHRATASSSQSNNRRIIDDLLLQAEFQEAIIEDAINICEAADAICREKDEQFKLSFTELPVWSSSPNQLIRSLCDD